MVNKFYNLSRNYATKFKYEVTGILKMCNCGLSQVDTKKECILECELNNNIFIHN